MVHPVDRVFNAKAVGPPAVPALDSVGGG